MKRKSQKPAKRAKTRTTSQRDQLPLIEHLKELRRRLAYVAICVAAGSAVAYGLEHQLVTVLLRPSGGQQFVYTSPLGGINFLFSVCLDLGLIVATPVIIYQTLAFMQPLMRDATRRFLLLASAAAGGLAVLGVLFGYFAGLPSVLHVLLHQFTTVQVRPLITIQSYLQFVALYLFGSALMFQLPLILLCINRIKPLKPSSLFKYERHLIVGAFIVAFIMNPTPNIIGQLMVVVPMIVSYQVGIGLLWLVQRGRHASPLESLLAQDIARRAERAGQRLESLIAPSPALVPATDGGPELALEPVVADLPIDEGPAGPPADSPTVPTEVITAEPGPATASPTAAENVAPVPADTPAAAAQVGRKPAAPSAAPTTPGPVITDFITARPAALSRPMQYARPAQPIRGRSYFPLGSRRVIQ